MSMQRKPSVQKFTFTSSTAGVTFDGKAMDVSQFAIVGIHASLGLNGRTLNLIDNGEWGAEIVLSKVLATGYNAMTQDELNRFSAAMQLTATIDTSATGVCHLKMKS
jgi:hypothetical protein